MTANQRHSLVEYARSSVDAWHLRDKGRREAHDEYYQLKREENYAAALEKMRAKAVEILELFDLKDRRKRTRADVEADLGQLQSKKAKVDYLKEAIKIRTVGFGWSDLHGAAWEC